MNIDIEYEIQTRDDKQWPTKTAAQIAASEAAWVTYTTVTFYDEIPVAVEEAIKEVGGQVRVIATVEYDKIVRCDDFVVEDDGHNMRGATMTSDDEQAVISLSCGDEVRINVQDLLIALRELGFDTSK